jgi:putative cell wall-binding protein
MSGSSTVLGDVARCEQAVAPDPSSKEPAMTTLVRPRVAAGFAALALAIGLLPAAVHAVPASVDRIPAATFADAGVAVSQRVFPDGAAGAVVAGDDNFPDALVAGALSASVGGPVLFTDPTDLTAATAAELDRVLPAGATVHVAGGPAAVSDHVVAQIEAGGFAVERVAGPTRLETAAAAARIVGLPADGTVLVARAFGPGAPGSHEDRTTGWVDSVSCGAYAAMASTPIVITETDRLSPAAAEVITELGATDAVVCGGTAAVGDAVLDALVAQGLSTRRVAGADRAQTAVAVAQELFGYATPSGRDAIVVNGYEDRYGFGLAAAPLAGSLGAPILLVDVDQPTACDAAQATRVTVCYLHEAAEAARVTIIGDGAAVSGAVADALGPPASPPGGGDGTGGGNGTGGGDGTQPPAADDGGALARPTGLSASDQTTRAGGKLRLTWKAVDDPDGRLAGYAVYIRRSGEELRRADSPADGPTTVGGGTTHYVVGNLAFDTSYVLTATSVTTGGAESEKAVQVVIRTGVGITPPTGVKAADASDEEGAKLRVEWTPLSDPGGEIAGYDIYLADSAGGTGTRLVNGEDEDAPTVAGNKAAHVITGLAPSTTYRVEVKTVTTDGRESEPSTRVTATTAEGDAAPGDTSQPPAPVTGLDATPGTGQVTLTWDAHPNSAVIGYRLQRSDARPVTNNCPSTLDVEWSTVADEADALDRRTTTSFVDDTVTSGTFYCYRIAAVDSVGQRSTWSMGSSVRAG